MEKQYRTFRTDFQVREDGTEEKKIEGYFAVFNSDYNMAPGLSESIAPGAFTESLSDDVRALINHDTTLVLGRTAAGTLELREDSHGLWGSIKINPNDTDALNLYERVKRGDVSQCSFGFDILDEETEYRGEELHFTIKKAKLYEVSPCTFPAYEATGISARAEQKEQIEKRKAGKWKADLLQKLKGKENAESTGNEKKN